MERLRWLCRRLPKRVARRWSSARAGQKGDRWAEHEGVSRWSLGLVRGLVVDWQSGMIYGGSMLVAVWVLVKIFIEPLKHDAVGQTVGVATKVINEGGVRTSALTLSRNVVRDVFNDEPSVAAVVDLVKRLCQDRALELAVVDFVRTALQHESNYETVRDWVAMVLADDGFRDIIAAAAGELVVAISRDEKFAARCVNHLADSYIEAVATEEAQAAAAEGIPQMLARAAGLTSPLTDRDLKARLEEDQRGLRRKLIATRERLTLLKLDIAKKRLHRLETLLRESDAGGGAKDAPL